jgi:DNA-binding NarL/FixJ family response regulator
VINVAIVDDHPLVAEGLALALETEADLHLVGTAATVAEARRLVDTQRPDVVILDVRLADGTGFDLLAIDPPRPAFLLLSSFDMPQYVQAALDLGAAGYILKTAPTADVVAAVRSIARGERAFHGPLLDVAAARPRVQLTVRERQIIGAILRGRSNDEIAVELHIARKTVEGHLSRLFQRFGVSTRTDLALRAEREGWLVAPRSESRGPA